MKVKDKINIVWLKKDLRSRDHASLAQAIKEGLPVLILFCFEPSIIDCPESDIRHWRFAYEALEDLQKTLQTDDCQLYYIDLEVIEALALIKEIYEIQHLYSYEEVGIKITFDRDKQVKNWCVENQIIYQEFAQNGTIRARKHRKNWVVNLEKHYFFAPLTKVDLKQLKTIDLDNALKERFNPTLPTSITTYNNNFQKGGESFAWKYFHSFLEKRVQNYSKHISKPSLSRTSCSRLSPYITFGCISAREVFQKIQIRIQNSSKNRDLKNAQSRIWWRSHFIQKLETEWKIEKEPINEVFSALDRLEESPLLDAWKKGQTGYPMIDACMRCLHANGWINFRMRAMLVSFATFTLWLDWRPVATHLAKLFLDFDPGIHYPQIQMQAGLTAYHTLRIYNPTMQVQKHDKDGIFIRKWIPELEKIPTNHLAEPWKLTLMEQTFYDTQIGKDYPAPIVHFESATSKNKDAYWQWRQSPAAKKNLPPLLTKFCIPKDKEQYLKAENPS